MKNYYTVNFSAGWFWRQTDSDRFLLLALKLPLEFCESFMRVHLVNRKPEKLRPEQESLIDVIINFNYMRPAHIVIGAIIRSS